MASTTSFGTQYLPMSNYELVDGVMVPKASAPTLASTPVPATTPTASKHAGGDGDVWLNLC